MKWKVYRYAESGETVVGEYESQDVKREGNILRLFDYLGDPGDMAAGTKTVAYIPLNKYIVERELSDKS